MATKAEILAAADHLAGIVPRTRAIDLARDMLEAAEEQRMIFMQCLFGGTPCPECGTLRFGG
jgi:hypothetical protein